MVRIEQSDLAEEALLENLLELEVLGYELDAAGADVVCGFTGLEALQDGLRRRGWAVAGWEHRWIAARPCRLVDADQLNTCLGLLDALEDLDDVRSVTSNLEADDALLEALLT